MPLSFGIGHLGPVIDAFLRLHPALTFELDLNDRRVDLLAEGFDLAERFAGVPYWDGPVDTPAAQNRAKRGRTTMVRNLAANDGSVAVGARDYSWQVPDFCVRIEKLARNRGLTLKSRAPVGGPGRRQYHDVPKHVHRDCPAMQSLTTTELRAKLKEVLDRINEDHQPVAIRRSGGRGVVLLDAEDYESIVETLHLVRHPVNAERLRCGMAQHQAGETTEIDVAAYLD